MLEVERKNINREFFKSAIKRQMMRCVTKERYRAGVFVPSKKMNAVTEIVKEILEEDFTAYLVKNNPII